MIKQISSIYVDRLAFLNLDDYAEKRDIRNIRDYFYNEGLSQLIMRGVFALKLRDLYLESQEKNT